MHNAVLPWEATPTGAQVKLGQLGLLIVRKVKTDFAVVVLGKELAQRSVTIDEGKERAEYAARRWVAEAGAVLWSRDAPETETPPRTFARPGGVAKRSPRPAGA